MWDIFEGVKVKLKNVKKINKFGIAIIIIIIAIIVIDQISKIIIQNVGNIDIEQNTYSISGADSNSAMMYIVTNLIIILIIARFMLSQNQFIDKILKVFLSFIIAGGISNLIDRIARGYVLEWISVSKIEWLPMFNIADIFVLVGWILVVGKFTYFTAKELRRKTEK